MEPTRPRKKSQLVGGSLKKSPKARGAGSSEQLCYLYVRFLSCLESLFPHAVLVFLDRTAKQAQPCKKGCT